MTDLCIVFLHHCADSLTRFHFNRIQELNPNTDIVPLTFASGLPHSVCPTQLPAGASEWRNTDRLVYHWFESSGLVCAERYLIVEYDTLCTMPMREFFYPAWNSPVSCAAVVDAYNHPEWEWFREIGDQSAFGNHLFGMIPICGILLSYDVLAVIAQLSHEEKYQQLFCECRIGTLARTAGYTPVLGRPDIRDYISCVERCPTGPGVWHSVKRFH